MYLYLTAAASPTPCWGGASPHPSGQPAVPALVNLPTHHPACSLSSGAAPLQHGRLNSRARRRLLAHGRWTSPKSQRNPVSSPAYEPSRISAANAQTAVVPHRCAEDPVLGVAPPGHVAHQAAGPCGSADGAAEYFFDADTSGADERRHRVVSLGTQLAVLGFLGPGPTLAVAVLFRELIEFKSQLPEIH